MGQAVVQVDTLTPMAMLEKAIGSGANIEVLERLMGLQERWQANQAKRAFVEALSALRGDLPEIVKSRTVDFTTSKGRTHYRYEDLADMVEALAPVLTKHGLSFRWRTDSTQAGYVSVTTILSHRDGHSEETTLSGPFDNSGNKNPIQAIGSVVTYLQRYGLKAAIGIAAAADDDGQQGRTQQQNGHRHEQISLATDQQKADMREILGSDVFAPGERDAAEKAMQTCTVEQADRYLKGLTKTRKERLEARDKAAGERGEAPGTIQSKEAPAADTFSNLEDADPDALTPAHIDEINALAKAHKVNKKDLADQMAIIEGGAGTGGEKCEAVKAWIAENGQKPKPQLQMA